MRCPSQARSPATWEKIAAGTACPAELELLGLLVGRSGSEARTGKTAGGDATVAEDGTRESPDDLETDIELGVTTLLGAETSAALGSNNTGREEAGLGVTAAAVVPPVSLDVTADVALDSAQTVEVGADATADGADVATDGAVDGADAATDTVDVAADEADAATGGAADAAMGGADATMGGADAALDTADAATDVAVDAATDAAVVTSEVSSGCTLDDPPRTTAPFAPTVRPVFWGDRGRVGQDERTRRDRGAARVAIRTAENHSA